MSWTAGGVANSGFLQEAGRARSRHQPAVAAHRGRLWCLWADLSGHLWYAATTEDGRDFERREPFPFLQAGLPIVAGVDGELHAIIVQDSGRMTHYCRDADDWLGWEKIGSLAGSTDTMPALAAFHNQLFLAYVSDNALYYKFWNPLTLRWAEPILVTEDRHRRFDGPSLCVVEGALRLVCPSRPQTQDVLAYTFDEVGHTWKQTSVAFEGKLALGASCTSYGDTLYVGFTGQRSKNRDQRIYVTRYNSGRWCPDESVADVEAAETPQIAILNGRIHVIFNDNTPARDLRWFSRSILDYSPSSWMANIPDETLISNMTIPGTHDSCARTTIPFVKTQNLSITQQLVMGIRFFDLRLRLHRDGKLYCYHGGIPLGWPRVMSFESVMDEIWAFLRPSGSRRSRLPPTETVLISINNDNPSRGANNTPEIFYEAIAAAIDATPAYPDGTARWIVEPHTPRLGDVRGRAVLLRRYHGHPAIKPTLRHGIDLSAWINDSPDFTIITPTGVVVRLQDKWKYTERIGLQELVESKSEYVQAMMVRAMSSRPSTPAIEEIETDSSDDEEASVDGYVIVRRNHGATAGPISSRDVWFVNFCSAVGDPSEHGEVAQARWVAVGGFSNSGEWIDGVNVMTSDYLRQQQQQGSAGRKRLGIVPMDYPELPQDNDLVSKLIETNFSD